MNACSMPDRQCPPTPRSPPCRRTPSYGSKPLYPQCWQQAWKRVTVCNSTDTDRTAILKYKNAAVNPTTQMVDIMAALEQPQTSLPGQTLMLTLPPLARGVLVPAAAVTHSGNATTVYVRSENGVEARVVALLPMGNHYLATGGIFPGEELVVEGTALLKGIQLGLGGGE